MKEEKRERNSYRCDLKEQQQHAGRPARNKVIVRFCKTLSPREPFIASTDF